MKMSSHGVMRISEEIFNGACQKQRTNKSVNVIFPFFLVFSVFFKKQAGIASFNALVLFRREGPEKLAFTRISTFFVTKLGQSSPGRSRTRKLGAGPGRTGPDQVCRPSFDQFKIRTFSELKIE